MTDLLRTSTFSRTAIHDYAVINGFYAAENLEVEIDITRASKIQMAQLRDGVWDLISSNFDNVLYWGEDQGADLLVVSATESTPRQDFVVRPEIQAYDDLRGKVIAVDAAESGYVTPLRVLLTEAGLKENDDYTLTEFGATNQRIDSLTTGKAYGAMVSEGRALESGMWVLDSIARLFTHYASVIVVRREWAEANQPLLLRYLSAHLAAGAELSGSKDFFFAWDGLREMMEMRAKVGFLRGPVDPTRFATDKFFRLSVPN